MTKSSFWSARADVYTCTAANISAIERRGHWRMPDARASRLKQHRAFAQHRLRQVEVLAICGVETPIVNDGNLAPTRRHIFASATYYKQYDADPDPDNPDDDGKRRVARASWVFNCAQIDNYAPPAAPEPLGAMERILDADRFFAAVGARIVHGGQEAYYRPSTDTIHMPDENLFTGTATMTRGEAYFAVLGHEHIHWTGHSSRLDRNLAKRFGNADRAAEELVAEIGAAFLCAELGITQTVRPDHAQYLANWLQLLKHDPKAIFTAAARASEAVNYLRSLQPSDPRARTIPRDPQRAPPPEAPAQLAAEAALP